MPPIAIAAASPTARVSVATAMITNIRKKRQHELPEERLRLRAGRERGADVGDVAERAAQDRGGGERAGELRGPVADGARPGEVAGEREREGDGRVEVRAGDVPDGVDHRHDHEPERDRDADVAERVASSRRP